nr:MAG TPA: hypothetical protein [Caudoviricetes sp.]
MNYNPYGNFNPYFQPQTQQSQGMKLDRVADLETAKKYVMQPNTIVYLLDEKDPYLYMKQMDNTGKSTLRGFALTEIDLSKITDKRYVSRDDFESFKAEILDAVKGLNKGE